VRVLIIGAAGMIGRKLAERAGARRSARGPGDLRAQARRQRRGPGITVADVAEPELIEARPDVIFHLAAVLSGEAEADFDMGYRVNVDGTRSLFEAVRAAQYRPRLVFSSSIAVFGPPLPDTISDGQATTPATSYGTQKAIAELLLADYSRRGFLDGVGIRLPTICVRPGTPNRAASSFFSSIIREPLNGEEAVLPVAETVRHSFASPRAAVGFLVRAAELDSSALGERRSLTMPGVSATVGEQIAALRAVAGDEAVRRLRRDHDETIMRIVSGWPGRFDTQRAHELGFRAETSFEEIVRAHVEDELAA
jgi:D-erythronate 2-dehydrogenase